MDRAQMVYILLSMEEVLSFLFIILKVISFNIVIFYPFHFLTVLSFYIIISFVYCYF
jgi:hypothetical protein